MKSADKPYSKTKKLGNLIKGLDHWVSALVLCSSGATNTASAQCLAHRAGFCLVVRSMQDRRYKAMVRLKVFI